MNYEPLFSLCSIISIRSTDFNAGGTLKPVVNFELKSTTTMPVAESTTTHKPLSTEQPLYRLDRSNGQACILLQVDAIITVKYRTKFGEDQVSVDGASKAQMEKKMQHKDSFFSQEVNIYVPNDATVTGNCDNENTATMSLKWKAFVLSWSFAKVIHRPDTRDVNFLPFGRVSSARTANDTDRFAKRDRGHESCVAAFNLHTKRSFPAEIDSQPFSSIRYAPILIPYSISLLA